MYILIFINIREIAARATWQLCLGASAFSSLLHCCYGKHAQAYICLLHCGKCAWGRQLFLHCMQCQANLYSKHSPGNLTKQLFFLICTLLATVTGKHLPYPNKCPKLAIRPPAGNYTSSVTTTQDLRLHWQSTLLAQDMHIV